MKGTMKSLATCVLIVAGSALGGALAVHWGPHAVWAGPELRLDAATKAAEAAVSTQVGTELSAAFRQAARKALPCVVSIETRSRRSAARAEVLPPQLRDGFPFDEFFRLNPRLWEPMVPTRGLGSGFVIDPSGVILTNSHVVASADAVTVRFADGTEYEANEIKTDPLSDVAIIRIKPQHPLPALEFGDSDRAEIGDWVLAVGSPFGLDFSVTAGIISAKGRGPGINEREDYLQTDAAVNPGNSGGPLLGIDGKVLGVNVAISSRGGGSDGVSFAIPINMARWAARQLQENGTVRRGFLGVGIQALNKDLAAAFGTEVSQGALVTEVAPGSPAEAAKLQPGDVIKKFNGIPVRDPRHLQVLVERVGAGESCTLELIRNGESMTATLTAAPRAVSADRPSPSDRFEASSALGASGSTSFEQGFRAASLNADLARELGFPIDARGVVVTAVDADSAAAAAGMEAGMRIVRVGARNIETLDDLKQALKDSRAEPRVRMLMETPSGRRWVVLRRS